MDKPLPNPMRSLAMAVAATFAVFGTPALADDLLCVGTGWAKGQQYESTVVFHLDPTTKQASMLTGIGPVSGVLKSNSDMYFGTLAAADGREYWINLHRYTGRLVAGIGFGPGEKNGALEFDGTCKRAERKF